MNAQSLLCPVRSLKSHTETKRGWCVSSVSSTTSILIPLIDADLLLFRSLYRRTCANVNTLDFIRFLCPPPTAVMVGNSWWSEVRRNGEEPALAPPRVVVSISGEPTPPESSVEWAGASGKPFDATDPPNGTTFVGRCVGKQLFISEADEKRKKVEALVKVTAPSVGDEEGKVIGLFPSKPIKVISKPSKKRQSAKNLECMWSLVSSFFFYTWC